MSHEAIEREVRAANHAFYLAFTSLDIDGMDAVWAGQEDDVCVHPGWPVLRGWDAIRASWVRIFSAGDPPEFVLSGEQVVFEAGDEVVHVDLIENLRLPDGKLVGIAARNSFARLEGSWRMTGHVTRSLPAT